MHLKRKRGGGGGGGGSDQQLGIILRRNYFYHYYNSSPGLRLGRKIGYFAKSSSPGRRTSIKSHSDQISLWKAGREINVRMAKIPKRARKYACSFTIVFLSCSLIYKFIRNSHAWPCNVWGDTHHKGNTSLVFSLYPKLLTFQLLIVLHLSRTELDLLRPELQRANMNLNAVDEFSVAFAILAFSLFAMAISFVAFTLFYAVYKERKLRVSSAMPVLNLCLTGLVLGVVSGLFTLILDVIQINEATGLIHGVKCFVEEFSISVYFQALFIISAARYGLVLCGEKLCRVTVKQASVSIGATWIISAVYASFVTFYKHHEAPWPHIIHSWSRGIAAAQFTFLGFLHFGALCIYANLVIYFHQKKDNLPPDFYSMESSRRRMAERNIRVSIKNIQMIALIVGTLCACHLPYLGVVTTAMFTGQLSHNAKVFAIVVMHCGILLNFVIYGYLNKRFKRVIRPMLHRMISKFTKNGNRRRKINELLPQNNLSSSGISFNISHNSYELTRSKLAFFYR